MVVWIGDEKFLYKRNVEFLGEMLYNFSKTHVIFFGHKCIQIWTPLDPEIRQSEVRFSGQLWFSSNTVLVFRKCFGI